MKIPNRERAGFTPALPTKYPACGSAQGVSFRLPGCSLVVLLENRFRHNASIHYSSIRIHRMYKAHDDLFLPLMFSPSPGPGLTPGVGLPRPLLTPAFSSCELLRMTCTSCFLSALLLFVSHKRGRALHYLCRDIRVPVAPVTTGNYIENKKHAVWKAGLPG